MLRKRLEFGVNWNTIDEYTSPEVASGLFNVVVAPGIWWQHTAFCKNTGHGANAANKNMVTPPKLGGNPIP